MIVVDQKNRIYTLHTLHTSYQMKADQYDVLLHTYYGPKIENCDLSGLIQCGGRSFSPNPNEAGRNRDYSLDIMPQEYSTCGVGDFRLSSMELELPNGSHTADLRYEGFRLEKGKYELEGLPAFHCDGNEAETLIISLKDHAAQVRIPLSGFSQIRSGHDHVRRASPDGTVYGQRAASLRSTKYRQCARDIQPPAQSFCDSL